MRLLYQLALSKVPKKHCSVVIEYLRNRVAVGLENNPNQTKGRKLPTEAVYKYITTSRAVEDWLYAIDQNIHSMTQKKEATETWMIVGGYGAGKSHMKEYMLEIIRRTSGTGAITLELADLLQADLGPAGEVDDIYSLILLQTIGHLNNWYDKFFNDDVSMDSIRAMVWDYIPNNELIDILYQYKSARNDNRDNFRPLRNFIIRNGRQVFLPLMKLYKKFLGLNGICIFVDEFEDLHHLAPESRQKRFFESIRALYDTLAKAYQDPENPSFKMIMLCTVSYWEQLARATLSQGLETRIKHFEIPQLVDDEIIALAEKIHALYKKSGKLKHEIPLDFLQAPQYLLNKASIDDPLNPRFIIRELFTIIEDPATFIGQTQVLQKENPVN